MRLIILCNALDDRTRLERRITTDSPAASRKVFMLARAIARAGVRPLVLSMGRGAADGSARRHPATARRVDGVAALYLPFHNRRYVSELVSLFAPALALWRLRRAPGPTTILFYNQLFAYLPALLIARLLGFRCVLDIEDGATTATATGLRRLADILRCQPFEYLCSRALLACTALTNTTALRPTACYYGTIEATPTSRDWQQPVLQILLGGTLDPATGADLFARTIARLRTAQPPWAAGLAIHITGKGPSTALFEALVGGHAPALTLHGRTTDAEYQEIVAATHLGLALKPNTGPLAHTTFPSKVTEMAGSGMLVLSTDISDVRAVLGDGAVYLEADDEDQLIHRLESIVTDRAASAATAARGAAAVARQCAPAAAGIALRDFLFPVSA